ncbi:hypothetical protein [Franconibacter helveticus]|uniref:hypothetical protein n=1 Tax=Franconibacter helveticus TaxID=357240 RepID=UPI00290CE995|nr:hypothetical protein [Franconibacter helveticus]MDU6923826.1 hypothetical protein [Franconibacter helveticus]
MISIITLVFIGIIFLCMIYSIVVYYLSYRKHTAELASAFKMLNEHSLIHSDNYLFYEQLGAPGFGYRVSIMALILKGKRFQLDKERWIEPEAAELIKKHYDFSWIRGFYRNIMLMGLGLGCGLIVVLADMVGQKLS